MMQDVGLLRMEDFGCRVQILGQEIKDDGIRSRDAVGLTIDHVGYKMQAVRIRNEDVGFMMQDVGFSKIQDVG